jgi:hypothetical protein
MAYMEDIKKVKSLAVGLSQRLLIVTNSFRQGEKMLTAVQEADITHGKELLSASFISWTIKASSIDASHQKGN